MAKDDAPLEFTPSLILRAYAAGVFPMAEAAGAENVFWVDPKIRGVLPLERFHVPRSLARRMRAGGYALRIDADFSGVVAACAERDETWINRDIRDAYVALHELGFAHSVEVWSDGALAGGLYGVKLGAAFFGESMFHRRTDASKIALTHLVARLKAGGFTLLDTQFVTDHLARFGAARISRQRYHRMLQLALRRPADFAAFDQDASADSVLQAATQTS